MINSIENDELCVRVKEFGAELTSLYCKSNHTEYLWQGDPAVWSGQSPILFPIIGRLKNDLYTIGGKEYNITCVSMGNPHCVVFMDDIDNLDIEKVGPEFEFDKLFPERVNTEFVTVLDDHTIKMRVWERGSGETWACGTGACAVAVAACENGFCKKGEDIKVKLLGGDLIINYTDETVYMTGNAEKVFDGEVEV